MARADTRTNFRLNSGSFSGSELLSTRLTCSSNLCQEKFGDAEENAEENAEEDAEENAEENAEEE